MKLFSKNLHLFAGYFGSLDLKGDFSLRDSTSFVLVRYKKLGDNITYDTKYNASDWNAVIAGYECKDGDINEGDTGGPIKMYMKIKNNQWYIRVDFWSHGNHESWSVDVLFIRKNFSKRIGFDQIKILVVAPISGK